MPFAVSVPVSSRRRYCFLVLIGELALRLTLQLTHRLVSPHKRFDVSPFTTLVSITQHHHYYHLLLLLFPVVFSLTADFCYEKSYQEELWIHARDTSSHHEKELSIDMPSHEFLCQTTPIGVLGVEIISAMAPSAMALLLVGLLSAAAGIAALNVPINSHDEQNNGGRSDQEVKKLFEKWIAAHDKSYNGLTERKKRFGIFKDNMHHFMGLEGLGGCCTPGALGVG
ncbi:hypothetical protein EJ110_NYTH01223 [Nymphaea thermarum]|nr:hypothetical protein EJ110_NYTH01223 [Nymphaea thermarum]